MLRRAKEFERFKLRARDGDIGRAREFYFDDDNWTVRYLVADTDGWLRGRKVLISPFALDPANEGERVMPVKLTKKQIEDSPSLASDEPVSRQYEMQYHGYFGWPGYWYGPDTWGPCAYPELPPVGWFPPDPDSPQPQSKADPHLRSTHAVAGYHVQALDGEIGHVEDFIIDEETWTIRYLVVKTRNWSPGKHVLVSPEWIERVSWEDSKVFMNLGREIIKRSPEFDAESLNRDYEATLHGHYGRQGYWTEEPASKRQ